VFDNVLIAIQLYSKNNLIVYLNIRISQIIIRPTIETLNIIPYIAHVIRFPTATQKVVFWEPRISIFESLVRIQAERLMLLILRRSFGERELIAAE